jgi:hypothetical protein
MRRFKCSGSAAAISLLALATMWPDRTMAALLEMVLGTHIDATTIGLSANEPLTITYTVSDVPANVNGEIAVYPVNGLTLELGGLTAVFGALPNAFLSNPDAGIGIDQWRVSFGGNLGSGDVTQTGSANGYTIDTRVNFHSIFGLGDTTGATLSTTSLDINAPLLASLPFIGLGLRMYSPSSQQCLVQQGLNSPGYTPCHNIAFLNTGATFTHTFSTVPVPAAGWLMCTAFVGVLGRLARRRPKA